MTKKFELDLGFSYTPKVTPTKIAYELMPELFKNVPDTLKIVAKDLLSNEWDIYVVDHNRGRCYYDTKTITIPAWAITKRDIGYKIYYIAHEFAHAFTRGDNHGSKFMSKLKQLCPLEYVHHELDYKPRAAKAAGISRRDLLDLF